jgi:hypothetical protein
MKLAQRTLSCDAQRGNGNIPRGGLLDRFNMSSKNDLPILVDDVGRAVTISRREAGKRLLAGMAAGAAAPWMTSAHPIWKHFGNDVLLKRAESVVADEKLAFLNQEQFASLVAAAESILPGSTKVGVAKFIDLLLSVDSPLNQKEFLGSLAQVESESSKLFNKNFVRLSLPERNELFTALSTPGNSQAGDASNLKGFLHLREWIAGSYYSSEIGMRELGWTPDRVFAEFPGCSQFEVGH